MFGVFFGTVCLFGLMGMARRAAWRHHAWSHGYAGYGGYGGGCGGHGRGFGPGGPGMGGRRGGPWGRASRVGSEGMAKAAAEVLKRRLRVDEEQEPIIDHAVSDLHAALRELGGELKETRTGLADALRGEAIDDSALAAIFARQDDALQRARRQAVSAVKQVHAVLDADQRKAAADWIASRDVSWI